MLTIDEATPRARLINAATMLEPVHAEDVLARLERLKAEHGASDQLIADVLGIHRNTVGKWRRREQQIDHPRMVGLALVLFEHQVRRQSN